jgi:hypothetical protein
VAYGQPNERWMKGNIISLNLRHPTCSYENDSIMLYNIMVVDGTDDVDAQRDRVIRALDMAAAWNEFINPSVMSLALAFCQL